MKTLKPLTKQTLIVNLKNMITLADIEIQLHDDNGNLAMRELWAGYKNASKEALQLAERLRPIAEPRVRK